MDYRILYQLIYAFLAGNGRKDALFGSCESLAFEAFCRSVPAAAFPELWFEIPLAGDPWFDLHALTHRNDLTPEMTFSPETTGGYPEVFSWFAGADDVRQLALSYDVSSGNIDHPAVQLLLDRQNYNVGAAFLQAAGRPDSASAYLAFVNRLPKDWYACYTGVFPARAELATEASHPWVVRVEVIPAYEQQRAYAKDASLLKQHLAQVGLTNLGNTLLKRCQFLAGTPFQLEFQFDVSADGLAADTFGASLRFAQPPGDETFASFERAGDLMRQVQDWGLADDRWSLMGDTTFAKRAARGDKSCCIFGFPTFIKLRWRGGEPLDAKAYLIAGVQE